MLIIGKNQICADGTHLKIIAGQDVYSLPEGYHGNYISNYTHLEVAVKNKIDEWEEFLLSECEDMIVYGYVPLESVEEFVALHGGLDVKYREPDRILADEYLELNPLLANNKDKRVYRGELEKDSLKRHMNNCLEKNDVNEIGN